MFPLCGSLRIEAGELVLQKGRRVGRVAFAGGALPVEELRAAAKRLRLRRLEGLWIGAAYLRCKVLTGACARPEGREALRRAAVEAALPGPPEAFRWAVHAVPSADGWEERLWLAAARAEQLDGWRRDWQAAGLVLDGPVLAAPLERAVQSGREADLLTSPDNEEPLLRVTAVRDLSPAAWRKQRRQRRQLRRATAIAWTAAIFLVAFAVWQAREREAQRETLRALRAEGMQLRMQAEAVRTRVAEAAGLEAEHALLQAVDRHRGLWQARLADLHARLQAVQDVWLDRMELLEEGDGVAVTGRMVDRENPLSRAGAGVRARSESLLATLADSPFIARVDSPAFDAGSPGLLHFEARLYWEEAP